MQSIRDRVGVLALAVFTATIASTAQAQLNNDQENFYGDRLRLSVDAKARLTEGSTEVCIPGGTSMVVVGQKDGALFVKLEVEPNKKGCNDTGTLSPTSSYTITREAIDRSGTTRTGITYGTLMIPFKYHTTGAKDFTGSATVGGYSGYRVEWLRRIGVTATPIAFMGASNISVAAPGGTGTDNVMGFSYGIGLIGTFKGSFQTGVVLGWDRVGKSAGYQYNGKPWIALEIGYAFLQ
jgi:hypothetical protein